jgi:hypothetical protein
LNKKIKDLHKENLIRHVGAWKRGMKKNYQITKKGIRLLINHRIRIVYGLIGLNWAENLWKRGYKVHFLSDFTDMEGHDQLLLVWNPQTEDIKIAEIFGVGEFGSESEGPGYVGQYVDRKTKPDGPIRYATLKDFIKNHVKNFDNEAEVGVAVKKFFKEHNAFMTVLLPQEITFGFPKRKKQILEVGRFSSLMFIGFKGEGDIPFIRRMNIMAGGFNLTENIKISLKYQVDLTALYVFAWLAVRRHISPEDVPQDQLNAWLKRTWLSALNPDIGIACKNSDEKFWCKKFQKKCTAVDSERGIDLKKCPIIVEDVKQVMFQNVSGLHH